MTKFFAPILRRSRALFPAFLLTLPLQALAVICPVYLAEDAFIQIFHGVTPASEQTVTSLREELKVIVSDTDAKYFRDEAEKLTLSRPGAQFAFRDAPAAGKTFVTDTWYWSPFKNQNERGQTQYRAVLRARLYDELESGVRVADLPKLAPKESAPVNPVPLADGNSVYRKLEFKVGHPYAADSGMDGQIPGVVDKPGIVLPERDILLLLKDERSFLKNRERLLAEGALLTRNGRPVNSYALLLEMFSRIGRLHRETSTAVGDPVVRIRYKREAWQATFTTTDPMTNTPIKVPVQITFDREVELQDLTSKIALQFDQSNFALTANGSKAPVTVVEFKIPLTYASLSDAELTQRGLGSLAEMRARYLQLSAVKSSIRNSGKQSNGLREMERAAGEF